MAKASKKKLAKLPSFNVVVGMCLDYKVYRGFASLRDLAKISKPDIFDQKNNPLGTQRNLSRQHARKAYEYVTTAKQAFFPEIILNIRDSSFVKIATKVVNGLEQGTLQFVKNPKSSVAIAVSRLDGNHRLWFADGHDPDFDPVDRPVSFCILTLSKLNDELALFRAINDNQMGMNTSHLENITARLEGPEALKHNDPPLYIVKKLQSDEASPFYQKIHEGGVVNRGATIPGLTTANLKNAVQDILSRSTKLQQFSDVDVQYELVKNFWLAVEQWLPAAWERPGDYIIFKGVGLYAVTYLGIDVIDRCLVKGKYSVEDMLVYLKKLPQPDLLRAKGPIAYAGRAGGKTMARILTADLEDDGEISLSKLQKKILGQ